MKKLILILALGLCFGYTDDFREKLTGRIAPDRSGISYSVPTTDYNKLKDDGINDSYKYKQSYIVTNTSKNVFFSIPTRDYSINFMDKLIIKESGEIIYLGRIITTDKEIFEALQHVLMTGKPKERK